MEILFYKGDEYVFVEDILDITPELREEMENEGSNGVYSYVKVEVIEKLYQALKEKYGRVESC
jgi:hypothetical protein